MCVDVVIKAEEGIVLSKREIEPDRGKWHIPGGTVLFGEKVGDAAKRVALEETGLTIDITDSIGILEYGEIANHGHAISIVYLARPVKGKLRGSSQGRTVRYFKNAPKNMIKLHRELLIGKKVSPELIAQVLTELEKSFPPMPESYTEMSTNNEIRWKATAMAPYSNEKMTDYYLRDPFAKHTRWDFWTTAVKSLKKEGVKTVLDIGAGNGHFVYLCLKNGINAWGVEPRTYDWVDPLFKKDFGTKRIYRGTLKTVGDYFLKSNAGVKFDCVTVLNFLHGDNHKPEEIINLYRFLRVYAKYVLCSEPQWQSLGIPSFLETFERLAEFSAPVNHYLYKVR